jgi:phosphatidylinositol N-acetylglucosaminyltransferase subunit H
MTNPPCSLRTLRPTTTTVSYIVSTRTPRDSLWSRLVHWTALFLRILIICQILLVLWFKWNVVFHNAKSDTIPPWMSGSPFGQVAELLVTAFPGPYLVPIAIFCIWILVKRGYTGT